MSTKLHHGFRLHLSEATTQGLLPLHHWLMTCRRQLHPLATELLTRWFVRQAVELYDRRTMGWVTDVSPESPVFHALKALFTAQQEITATQTRHPDLDVSVEVTLIPVTPTCCYGLYFAEQAALITRLFEMPGIEPYPYYDHTDHPDTMSLEAWQARGREWDALLREFSTPALSGLTATLVPENMVPDFDALRTTMTPYLPSLASRVQRLAQEVVLKDAHCASLPEAMKILAQLDNDPYRTRYQAAQDELQARLILSPTYAQLNEGLPSPALQRTT